MFHQGVTSHGPKKLQNLRLLPLLFTMKLHFMPTMARFTQEPSSMDVFWVH